MIVIPSYLGRKCNICGLEVRSANSSEVMVVKGYSWHKPHMDLQTIQTTELANEPQLIILDPTKNQSLQSLTPVEETQRLVEKLRVGMEPKKVMCRVVSAETLPGYMLMNIGVPVPA
jgi:hypothetical protein